MRIKTIFAHRALVFLLIASAAGFSSCATQKAQPSRIEAPAAAALSQSAQSPSVSAEPAQRIWSKKMPGLISDVALSRDGRFVLMGTIPNREIVPAGDSEPNLLRLKIGGERGGRISWRKRLPAQVKSLAISDDGALSVANTYQDQLVAFNAAGRKLWAVEAVCSPYILTRARKVLCYHDDDAEPRVAFDVFDASNGRKLESFQILNDIVAFKVSKDERNIVLGLTQGQLILVGPDFKTVWQRQVPGEIADVAVSNGAHPKVAVISRRVKSPQEAIETDTVFDSISEQPIYQKDELPPHAAQVEISPDGLTFWLYFGPKGALRLISKSWKGGQYGQGKVVLQPQPLAMDLPEVFESADDSVMTVLPGRKDGDDILRLVGFDSHDRTWEAPLSAEENLYLGVYAVHRSDRVIGAAMDDGSFSVFRITK